MIENANPVAVPVGLRRGRIAVVGTGAAGLAAALSLCREYAVHLFEAEARPGGHCNTMVIDDPSGPLAVDTGFIVFNPVNYPTLCRAFDFLGVASRPSEMSFSVSCDGGRFEYSGRFPRGLVAQPGNLLRPRFWRMLHGLRRFYAEALDDLPALEITGETLGDYLSRRGYPASFRDDHLAPMAAAIWSQPQGSVEDMPAATLVRFFEVHGLLRLANRPRWRTVEGGSREYVRRILDHVAAAGGVLHLGSPVEAVTRGDNEVTVSLGGGRIERFDGVVIATHADQALGLLADADVAEQRLLGAFPYKPNHVVLHRDRSLMPRRRAAWAAWNYVAPSGRDGAQGVTYWMNRLQGYEEAGPVFVTLNPPFEPDPQLVCGRFDYSHPVFDRAAIAAQPGLVELQGRRRTWFCGSYFGYGFHEDAFASGIAAARAMGISPPWENEPQVARAAQ
jgi:predicted NAD/FAD-binding protein